MGAGTTSQTSTAGTNQYFSPIGDGTRMTTNELDAQALMRTAGVISNMGLRTSTNSVNNNVIVTLRNNAVSTAMSVTITAGATGYWEDTIDTVTIAAGDKLSLLSAASGTTGTYVLYGVKLEFDTLTSTTNSITRMGATNPALNTGHTAASTTWYYPLNTRLPTTTGTNTVETGAQVTQQYAGTYRNLACYIALNARTTNTTIRFRKNTANGNQSIVIPGGGADTGWFEDTTNSDSVVANDLVNYSITNGTGTLAISISSIMVGFQTTTDPGVGALMTANTTVASISNNATQHAPISGMLSTGLVNTEALMQYAIRDTMSFKGLTIKVVGNTNNAPVVKLRVATADSLLSIAVASSTTGTFSNLVNTVTIASGDMVNYKVTTGATGTTFTLQYIAMWSSIAGVSTLQNLTRTVGDSLVLSHGTVMYRLLNQTSTDSLTLTHTSTNRNRLLNKIRSDSFSLSSGHVTVRNRLRAIADALTIAHTSTMKIENKVRLVADTLNISSVVNRLRARNRSITGEGITLGSTLTRLRNIIRNRTDSLSLSETILRTLSRIRTTSHILTLTSDHIRLRLRIKALAESMTMNNTLLRLKYLQRIQSHTLSLTSDLIKLSSKNRSVSDNISLTSIHNTVRNRLRSITEGTVSLSSIVNRLRLLNRTESSSLTLSSTVTKLTTRLRTISDNIGLTDISVQAKTKLRSFLATITLTDLSTRAFVQRIMSINHSLTLASATTKLSNKMRELSDIITISAQIYREKGIFRSLQESLGLLSSNSRTTNRNRVISDTLSLAHGSGFDTVREKIRMVTHSITVNDIIQTGSSKIKTIYETLVLSDDIIRIRNKITDINHSISLNNSILRLRSKLTDLQHEITLDSNHSKVSSRLRTFTDNINLDSIIETGSAKVKIILHQLNLDSQALRLQIKIRELQHNLTVESMLFDLRTSRLRTITDNINISADSAFLKLKLALVSSELLLNSSITRYLDRLRYVQSSLSLNDSVQKQRSITRSVSQTLSLLDSSIYSTLHSLVKNVSDSLALSSDTVRLRLRKVSTYHSLNVSSVLNRTREALIRTINDNNIVLNSTVLKGRDIRRTIAHSLSFTETILKQTRSAIKSFHLKLSRYRLYRY